MEISGPVDCMDSAIALNCSLLRDRSRQNPSQAAETSEKIMSWLFRRWKPGKVYSSNTLAVFKAYSSTAAIHDRQGTTKISQHCPVYSIIQLISICLGGDYMDKVPSASIPLGLLGRTRLKCIQDEASIRYLLLTDARKWPTRTARWSPTQAVRIALSGQQAQSVLGNTLNIISAEVRAVLDEGLTTSLRATPSLGGNIIKVTTSLCVVAHAVLSSKGFRYMYKRDDLQKSTDELTRQLIIAIVEEDRRQSLSGSFLEVFADFIPQVRNLPLERNMAIVGACSMLKAMGTNFWREALSSGNPDADTPEDGGEYNEDGGEFQPRGNHGAPDTTQTEISHEELTAATDKEAFRASMAAQLCWITTKQEGQLDSNLDFMPSAFVEFLTSLQPPKFLGCRGFLRVLFGSGLTIDAAEASTVLEYVGETMLRPYILERCEVALGLTLDVMKGLVEVWTNQGNGEAAELGGHIYEWFIEIALSKGICSTHVHTCLSSLLQRVIKCNPDYAKNLSLPSARTSLFRVLQEGSLKVKFHVGNNISEIFGLFVLKEHESILEDVIQTLPKAVDWIDGIASRLFILAHLASSWPTLLRRCIYAIFEAPRSIPESTGHARQCLTQVASSLGLKNPRELFKLFVSQIIYTWLETQSLGSIPYSVFGFDSLAQLLQDVQDEVVGQIVMRGREGEGTDLAQDFGRPFHQLVEESITKTAGYCIARDVAMPPSRNTHAPGAEVRLRKLVGKEQYASLVAMRYCEVLSVFFKSMDEEEKIERGFGDKPSNHNAHVTYQAVKANAASGEVLPLAQQPSFKARYIFDEIEHLCRRTNTDISSVWTPSAYVYLFRELLDTIHPALGSLHACYVIRKLRVLMSLAGPTALQYYPLEMALHSLRPFLTDTHCAEDTIGIVQYLLTAGSAHMREVPSFLAGMAVVCLTSMKAFLGSSQESTTQESQYKATMNNAYKFHSWFASYLSQYESHRLSESFLISFRNIVKAAWNAQANGNARRESYESDLLMEILDDQLSCRNLLNQPSKDLILRLQCGNFQLPTNFRDDILGSDSQAVKYSPVLWKICQRGVQGRQFRLWVSRALGRAYAASGHPDRNMTLEVPIEIDEKEPSAAETSANMSSRARILKLLCDVLLVDDRNQISIVEKSLRSMISQAKKTTLLSEFEAVVPPSMMEGLLWQQDHFPSLAFLTEKRTVESVMKSEDVGSNPKWMQSLCVELTQTSSDDPILSELPPILTDIDGIAERLFPFVLHLSLNKDYTGSQDVRHQLSALCQRLFVEVTDSTIPQVRLVLQSILYLRKQPLPHESTKADRTRWLQIDFKQAALAAVKCSMFKTALLFLDIHYSEAAKSSRRASDISIEEPTDLLLYIYQNIDEQDSFYGVQQPSSLSSMMSVLEYEHAGFKSLSFQGAHYDTQIRFSPESADVDETGMIRALDSLDLNGLSQSLMRKLTQSNSNSFESMLDTARKLEQWDVSAPVLAVGSSGSIFRAFQGISNAPHGKALHDAIDSSCAETFQSLMSRDIAGSSIHKVLSVLATLTELDEVFSSIDAEQFMQVWARFKHRESWMLNAK